MGSAAVADAGTSAIWLPGLIVSAAGSLFFRDVKFIVEVLLTFGIFFTPVFYDVGMFGDKGKWLLLNPVGPILEGLSACIARQQPPTLSGWPTASALRRIEPRRLCFL